MIPEEIREIAQRIGQFFLEKNQRDYVAARLEIEKMRINKLSLDGDTLTMEVSRPGLLIGRRGEQIDKLTQYLGHKIKIVETRETILDYLLPYDYEAELY